jgi:hypothetical protein
MMLSTICSLVINLAFTVAPHFTKHMMLGLAFSLELRVWGEGLRVMLRVMGRCAGMGMGG